MIDLQHQDFREEGDVRIHLSCKNVFLSLSLGFYLKGHLSAIDKADFIITDIANLKREYAHLPICVINKDLHIPCSVYEMFSQLHDFYSHVNAKQAAIFQQDLQHINQNEIKKMNIQNFAKDSSTQKPYLYESTHQQGSLIESIKKEKMQEIIKNTDPALSSQIEILFNELSKKIYDTLREHSKK